MNCRFYLIKIFIVSFITIFSTLSYSTWNIEEVDNDKIRFFTSIDLDNEGNIHISYHSISSSFDDYLKYAFFDGSNWQIYTIDSDGTACGGYNSIAVDSNGKPHITYSHNEGLKYAYFDGNNWDVEIVFPGELEGSWCSIELDSQDRPHISFNAHESYLGYAYFDGNDCHLSLNQLK
jgi:hypothetical protein